MLLGEENTVSAALFMLLDARGQIPKVHVINNLQSVKKNKGQCSTHGVRITNGISFRRFLKS